MRVFSFSIIVSLDYLMKIKDFLNYGPPTQQAALQSTQKVQNEAILKKKVNQPAPNNPPALTMTINIHVEKPDIILLEDMDDIDSHCIVLNVNYFSLFIVKFTIKLYTLKEIFLFYLD